MTIENSNFSNYPAFAANFEDILIVRFQKTKNSEYFVFNNAKPDSNGNYNLKSDSWIQKGNADYINGWLYGAVQAKCKVIKTKI